MFLLTGNVTEANTITLIVEGVKTLNFFLFDYVWDKIKTNKEEKL